MNVRINGCDVDVAEKLTVAALVAERGLDPSAVVVEHNRVVLPNDQWPLVALAKGDEVEIVTFMGGG